MKQLSGAIDGDNANFVNIPLSAKEVLAVCYMREVAPNSFRVSLRSKGDINVAKICESFGGGGHKNAAGCAVQGDWDDVENWSQVTITFSDGSKGVVAANDICVGGMKDTLDIYLSNARMHCDFSRTNTLQAYAPDATVFEGEYLMEKLETPAGWSFPSVDEEWFLGYRWELQDFVEAVKFDREPLADGRLGRDVVHVIYSAYLSAAEGRLVRLDQPD